MYEEGNGHGPGSDLDAMKAYLMVKVMADPSVDDDAIISEFLDVRPSLQLSCSPPSLRARPRRHRSRTIIVSSLGAAPAGYGYVKAETRAVPCCP